LLLEIYSKFKGGTALSRVLSWAIIYLRLLLQTSSSEGF